ALARVDASRERGGGPPRRGSRGSTDNRRLIRDTEVLSWKARHPVTPFVSPESSRHGSAAGSGSSSGFTRYLTSSRSSSSGSRSLFARVDADRLCADAEAVS